MSTERLTTAMDLVRNDFTNRVLEKALDGLSQRQSTITNNMANVDTPNFKASEVSFEEQLQAAVNRKPALDDEIPLMLTNNGHIPLNQVSGVGDLRPASVHLTTTTMRNDGNNVDVDREMTRLAETQLSYQATTQLVNTKLHLLRQAIWEGKK